jgi:ankyrin repeat protein
MFRVFGVIGVFWVIFFTYAGSIGVAALQLPGYFLSQREKFVNKEPPAAKNLPPKEPFVVQGPPSEKNYSDLQPKPEILKVSECDQRTRNAWSRFNYIVEKFLCKRGDNEYRLLEALLREHPTLLGATDNRGHSLLALAILFRRADVVALLLFMGCALETRDAQGNTPLLLAAKEGFVAAVVLLSAYGANPNACNNDGLNIYHLACALDHIMCSVVFRCFPYDAKSLDK